ncbi:peptidase family C54 [Microdochium trichocladiopsis]|uniref:Cysteine protease n=1 Tax=Microdochium trichocladiopsis TaxID=1682393 RepID=A0A9P8Y4W1_9PEZI|nr:peptidase family C54 [Microdochium trichocladiopsis]KAH7029360.1 peptidase family C54 [Microdochium trichocladiopsis]
MDSTLDVGRRIVQMFWDPDPTNDIVKDVPVWCLGSSYRLNAAQSNARASPAGPPSEPSTTIVTTSGSAAKDGSAQASSTSLPDTPPDSISTSLDSSLAYEDAPRDGGWPPAFLDDFESRIWMTYRSEFEPIAKSQDPKALAALSFSMRLKTQLSDQAGFSTDTGWGCMIRSGQSLLANAMLSYRYGGSPRRVSNREHESAILQLFADDPRAPYSIHNFVRHGAIACGKYPGEWFGPSATARCIQALAKANDSSLRVYSTGDGPDVYEDKFFEVAKPDGQTFHPTLILVGTRLGIDKITQVYWEALVASLQMPQSIGIAGGRPSSSHYFIGVQGLHFFYLDPHFTRPALPYHERPEDYTREEIETCHTRRLRRLHIREMDPSMLIGFLIRDEEDWKDWRRSVKHVQGKNIIHVSDCDPVAQFSQRAGAIDQIEALSDDDDDDENREAEDRV